MLNIVTLFVTTIGTLLSFTAILAQFIGAEIDTLVLLSLIQLIFLGIAVLLGGIVFSNYLKHNKSNHRYRRFFVDMPGWLMFILILMIVTALLGDLSVFLVRAIGHSVSNLFHLPSLCILVFTVIYRVVHLNITRV